MHEGAYLRRSEARGFIGLRLQPVLAEVRKLAGGEFIHARGRELQLPAVERLHRVPREPAPAHLRGREKAFKALWALPSEILGGGLLPRSTAAEGVSRKSQRRSLGRHAGFQRVRALYLHAEKRPRPVHHKGRALLRALAVHGGIAHHQALRGQGEAVVDERKLAPQLALSRAAEVDVHLKEPPALVVGEHSHLRARLRHALVADAKDDEVLYAAPAHTVEVSGGDPVERHGNSTHVVF